MDDSIRIASFILALIFYMATIYPEAAIWVFLACVMLYFVYAFTRGYINRINNYKRRGSTKEGALKTKALNRAKALIQARLYLAPYDDIWKNLKLTNKYVSARLGSNGRTITVSESASRPNDEYRIMTFNATNNHGKPDIWNYLCINFNNYATYQSILDLCKELKVPYSEQIINKNNIQVKEKIDINNASEVEITSLPGISIVLSKKIIKKREEIGGFKSTQDFFAFIKLKPHMESQLKDKICVNKMRGSLKIERSIERQIDL